MVAVRLGLVLLLLSSGQAAAGASAPPAASSSFSSSSAALPLRRLVGHDDNGAGDAGGGGGAGGGADNEGGAAGGAAGASGSDDEGGLPVSDEGYPIPPSWIPGLDGIDEGVKLFTYKKDAFELICMVVIGFVYKTKVTSVRPPLPATLVSPRSRGSSGASTSDGDDFVHGKFSCLERSNFGLFFVWSLLLQHIRMGDTFFTAGVTSFWAPFWVFFSSRVIANLMGQVPGMVCGLPTMSMLLFQALFYVRWRQGLRARLGSPAPQAHCLEDLALYTCCAPCLVLQEAKEIDMANAVRVGCCCTIELVGEPVYIQA